MVRAGFYQLKQYFLYTVFAVSMTVLPWPLKSLFSSNQENLIHFSLDLLTVLPAPPVYFYR